jgi:thiamine biosynthesis lipoprotein
MGTNITLYVAGTDAEGLIREAENRLIRYENIFSANHDHSQLAMLKKQASSHPIRVDKELYDLIQIGKEHSLKPNSFLNIAIGPLIKLWEIGFLGAHVPEKAEIEAVLELLNPELIQLDDEQQTVFLAKIGMEIDLGAIAKGYFADQVMAFFKQNGAVSAMVDLGGNVLVHGDSPSGSSHWKVGIQNPFLPRGHSAAIVNIREQSVVRCGLYYSARSFHERDRGCRHHNDRKPGLHRESEGEHPSPVGVRRAQAPHLYKLN